MDSLYSFTWHDQARLIEARLVGHWSLEDVESYFRALNAEIASHAAGGAVKMLVDLTNYPAQQPAVADMNQARIKELRTSGSLSGGAFVVSQAVAKLQHSRNVREANAPVDMFTSRDEAWTALTGEANSTAR